MRDYEAIYILNPNLAEEEAEKITLRMQEVVVKNGGEVTKVEKWGKRKLAYLVKKQRKGDYVLLQFQGDPVAVAELERNFKMTDQIIKYMTIKMDKHLLAAALPPVVEAPAAETPAAEGAEEATEATAPQPEETVEAPEQPSEG